VTLQAKPGFARPETPGRSIEVAGRRPVVALRPLPALALHFAGPPCARSIAPAADFLFDLLLLPVFGSLGHLPGLIALGLGGSVERSQAERQCEQQGRSFHGGVPFIWLVSETACAHGAGASAGRTSRDFAARRLLSIARRVFIHRYRR
jgi:hypothetical protein